MADLPSPAESGGSVRCNRDGATIDAGIAAQINHAVSAYASAGYTTSVDSTHRDDITGRLGFRVSWQ